MMAENPFDHGLEDRLVDVERSGDRRTEGDLDGDDDAAALEGIDDPAETAQRHGKLCVRGMFQLVHRPQHRLEDESYVIVVPRAGLASDAFQRRRRRDIGSAQLHVDLKTHTSIASSAAASLTGA